jgi:3-hydroxybutyryl-CoA dehydrogenase
MKKLDDIKRIGVLGAGVMGSGIAVAAASSGFDVVLVDVNASVLEKAQKYADGYFASSVEKGKITATDKDEILSRIHYGSTVSELKADFVIEAILENLELKQRVFKELEEINAPDSILGSNTSTLPITRIANGLLRPAQVVGMHFFNPAPIMKLVEVIPGEMTSPEVTDLTVALAKKMGKTPVLVKDEPGFVVNRVARHYYLESLKACEEQVASFETIDNLLEATGFKMGPFKLMDLIGVETNHEVTKSLWEAFFRDEKFRPSRLQQKKVDAGHHGRKTGRGFYDYLGK